jgi:SAM-dependent methyltransferase
MKWYLRYFLNALVPVVGKRILRKTPKCASAPFGKEDDGYILEQGIKLVQTLRQSGFNFSGSTVLELGTGRLPIMPIIMSLLNPKALHIIDSSRLLNEAAFRNAVKFLLREHDYIAEKLLISPLLLQEKLNCAVYMPLDEVLHYFRLTIKTPDATGHLNLADESIDLAFSFAALEHIATDRIKSLLTEFKRVLRSAGKMFHTIDTADHWSRIDRSITSVNFLKFEEHDWEFFNLHPRYYQNRNRQADYETLFENAGFAVEYSVSVIDPKALSALETMAVAEKYRAEKKESLATSGLQFSCGKKRENVQERIVKIALHEFRRRQAALAHAKELHYAGA